MIQDKLLEIFEGYRMPPVPADQYEAVGKPLLAERFSRAVSTGQPIPMVMLGFPFKSTNDRDKVLGVKPDAAEEETLKNFASFNESIKAVYPAGVTITIVSDGYVFNDLLGASDKVVAEYKEVSMDLGKIAPMEWYDLADFYSGNSLSSARGKVVDQFGISEAELERSILLNPDVNFLRNGMMRFMEEELANREYPSRNQLHKAAKALTKEMMLRNEAYSNLVKKEFSGHIRLSMHPSISNGQKYSFQLIHGENARHSAWHSCLLMENGKLATIHKKDAIAKGYELVYRNGQPYYFVSNDR